MNKLWLIIQREYLTRVKKKTFILATLLTPLGIGLIMVVSGYFATAGKGDKNILIKDDTAILAQYLQDSETTKFTYSDKELSEIKENYTKDGFDMVLHVPKIVDLKTQELQADFYTADKPSLMTIESLERRLSKALESYKLDQSPIEKETIEELKLSVTLENAKVKDGDSTGDGSSKMAIAISTGLSYLMGFLMYMVIFIYGSMVMRSVMEEKINRIVEVMISSVKPFYLMMGKIIGVGLVGLTQLVIWLILIAVMLGVSSTFFGADAAAAASTGQAAEMLEQMKDAGGDNMLAKYLAEIMNLNWWLIIPSFIVYFLGGFFIYSSLFAAVGSAIGDDIGEGQQLTMPIVIPVVLAMVMIPAVFNDPDGPIAIFGSMFPLFSPIIMPARLPFDPPVWQILVSILILLASVGFFAWFAGRIYRVGIFMYGKKVSFKEIGKWLFYKG